jgi:hypothetical protein
MPLVGQVVVQVVLPLLLGACQKFPQPAKSGAAAIKTLAHFPILISTCRPFAVQSFRFDYTLLIQHLRKSAVLH